ncbi:response regulator, putative [Geotalea daltonii FRC-32]|uniref:Response regulator, putative n=1 Tax=Geotalea daltonii (strain DSM 22248 / JCM 15807 / FRC-32) TaxID=316067 RepID=B9M6L3_GEODF|nr:response regulator [Geotalea daltonii]ACM20073.1 response regulator, putative [Geotalea daltonii FRC-32]
MENPGAKPARKILVMDDDEMIRFIAEQTLSKAGYDVTCVADGAAAVKAYVAACKGDRPYIAVFLDLNIPGGMGGKETMKRLLDVDPAAKGFVMSGDPTDPVMQDFAVHGFHGAVDKRLLYKKAELDAILSALA